MTREEISAANTSASTCNVALKEWAATCSALRAGRQILLLRKGGIADAGGVFELEHSQFWLWPTGWHQSATFLKADERQHLQNAPTDTRQIEFSLWAQAVQTWTIGENAPQVLADVRHIWSDSYLELRANYKSEHPLLCVALRVWEIPQPHLVAMRAEYGGCRSWIELCESLALNGATPVLDDETFDKYLQELNRALKTGTD